MIPFHPQPHRAAHHRFITTDRSNPRQYLFAPYTTEPPPTPAKRTSAVRVSRPMTHRRRSSSSSQQLHLAHARSLSD